MLGSVAFWWQSCDAAAQTLTGLFFVVAMDTETSPSHLQTKAYVRQLQVIDNQNLLFDMSCKLEPKDT